MTNRKKKGRMRSFLSWTLWVLLLQFVLINISSAFYAHKLTHLRNLPTDSSSLKRAPNIFAKTWRLFSGPVFYKRALTVVPSFPYETDTLLTSSGINIEAWRATGDSLDKGTIIMFHGLMGNKGLVLAEASEFLALGFGVYLVDVRNHGNSGGKRTTLGFDESEEVKLAFEHISSRGEQRIFLWGVSMGAVQILRAVAQHDLHPAGIMLEMPFLSLQSHLKGRARALGFPEQPFGFLTSFWIGVETGFNGLRFKADTYASKINCPVLMHYGMRDELVLMKETKEIYEAIPTSEKRLVLYDDVGHDSFLKEDPATWRREVVGFLIN